MCTLCLIYPASSVYILYNLYVQEPGFHCLIVELNRPKVIDALIWEWEEAVVRICSSKFLKFQRRCEYSHLLKRGTT